MLYIIGIGLADEKDITVKGLEAVKDCDKVYLEYYTSLLDCDVSALEKLYGKKIIIADRELVEQKAEETILKNAKDKNVAFLVIGDALSATTHIDLIKRAKESGIDVHVIHNASIMNAVAVTGLQLYKFGKTTSLPFWQENFKPETAYDVLKENKKINAHTLILLDLNPKEKRYMTVNEAIDILLKIEEKRKEKVFTKKTFCVGCARIGIKNPTIKAGKAEELIKFDFGLPPHCLIVPADMHFMEEEIVKSF